MGKVLGSLLIIGGLILQMIMPLDVWDVPVETLLAIPAELAIVFLGTAMITLGILVVYLSWFRAYADKLDQKVAKESAPS
ncbi:MAG: hypothetical protein HKM24_04620 [Gammaproteobacteria bacterium]|nr:hypothetical protein [Gammaproteobacteria bacterium]